MSSNEKTTLTDELERVYIDNIARLREIGGRSHGQDSNDIVHDAFAKTLAVGRRQTIRDPLHFVFKATRNTMLSRLRDGIRRIVKPFSEAEHAQPTLSTEHAVLAAERLRLAMDIIDRMPARRREAFLLHRIEELNYPQIARRMDISIKAVEKHISAALAQLHREIEG